MLTSVSTSIESTCGSLTKIRTEERPDSCEVFFPPILYFMPGLGLQLYTFIYMLHLDWAETEMFRITALDYDWPPLCMFMLPVRGPLFMDNRRTQIIIPLESKICFYYLRRVAMLLCTLTLPSDCLFIITAFLLSQRGPGQLHRGAKPFSGLFLSVTSLCIPLTHHTHHTHTHTRLGCRLGGAQGAHALAAGCFWSRRPSRGRLKQRCCARWPGCLSLWWNTRLVMAFLVQICNLPT